MKDGQRYLSETVVANLTEKVVLIIGPRQVGKTTFCKTYLTSESQKKEFYLNFDIEADRLRIVKNQLPTSGKLLVLDEIHKYIHWRQIVKGFYDQYGTTKKLLVTGSARLDHYGKGGDSLFGRTRYYRMHPFSLSELSKTPNEKDLEHLLRFGGFPEPFTKGDDKFLRLWQMDRRRTVIREDLRDLETVKEISLVELLAEALTNRVGSPLSLLSLKEDIQVSFDSVDRWIRILENLYFVFRIPPFGAPKIRAVKKEQKLYFWDWSLVENPGARFENLVASHLLKYCHFQQDTDGYPMELRFIRDTDKREIDFVVLKKGKPQFAVECKTGEKSLSPHVRYFKERTNIPEFWQVHLGNADFGDQNTNGRVLPFWKFIREKNLV